MVLDPADPLRQPVPLRVRRGGDGSGLGRQYLDLMIYGALRVAPALQGVQANR